MTKYKQMLARIGTGCTMIAALVWLLWPGSWEFANNPEAWFVFGVAFVVWVFTEIHESGISKNKPLTPNDVRVARKLVALHAGVLRWLLKDTDLWTFVPSERYSQLGYLIDDWEKGVLLFNDSNLNDNLRSLMQKLEILSIKIASDTVPVSIAGKMRTGYKPYEIVPDEEYCRRQKGSKAANQMATHAWEALDEIVSNIKSEHPSVFDLEIEAIWEI
ncbi:hypothetical protein MWU76_19020 [Gelidibacter sp. F2691]|nr:hypothetical protein [Gelidibacter sp. F2691]